MRKIVYSAAAALMLVLSAPSLTHAAKSTTDFSDLKNLDAATKAKFDALISGGVFQGVSEESFGLKEEMTRAQFAKVMALVLNLQVNTSSLSSSFKDVKPNDPVNGYALPYIEAIKKAGITNGDGNSSTFNPGGNVTLEELAAFAVRALNLSNLKDSGSIKGVSNWASEYVSLAVQYKLFELGSRDSWQSNASRGDLLLSSYEVKTQHDPIQLLGASATDKHDLALTFSASLKESQIDLSKIKLNGKPLDSKKVRFTLSPDGKTLTLIFDEPLSQDLLIQPSISVDGLQSITGNTLKTEKPVPVEKGNLLPSAPVTPPVIPETPSTYTPPSSGGGGYNPPADTTAPQWLSATRKGSENLVVLNFSEALEENKAKNAASYKLVPVGNSANELINLPDDTLITLSQDKKQVLIKFPSKFVVNGHDYSVPSFFAGSAGIQVSGITDLSGNLMSTEFRKVEVINPGLINKINFVKPGSEDEILNATKSVITINDAVEGAEDIEYMYLVSEDKVPAIIGLQYDSDENGSLGWGDALEFTKDQLIPVGFERTITVIRYNSDTKEVYGSESFVITEDQIFRSAELSRPITFTNTETDPFVYTPTFENLSEGHHYYFINNKKEVRVGTDRADDPDWSEASVLKPGIEYILNLTNYVTVIETVDETIGEQTTQRIIAYKLFTFTYPSGTP